MNKMGIYGLNRKESLKLEVELKDRIRHIEYFHEPRYADGTRTGCAAIKVKTGVLRKAAGKIRSMYHSNHINIHAPWHEAYLHDGGVFVFPNLHEFANLQPYREVFPYDEESLLPDLVAYHSSTIGLKSLVKKFGLPFRYSAMYIQGLMCIGTFNHPKP